MKIGKCIQFVKIYIYFIVIKILLYIFGLRRILNFLKRMKARTYLKNRPANEKNSLDVLYIKQQIDNVNIFQIYSAECLEQSLILFYLLLKKNIYNAKLKIGVCKYPFSAHAWVEYNGIVLSNIEFNKKDYSVIEEI
ncbi:Transglutaminase-like superfamily protein [Caldanaerobius fijiensis DSM 17918]|uniref:Transglutaminase-like superfamily protein n=1 Tax=Caldanaerobius fijiensis DSM 17918 TaxID=1121256 RepID=A0A1M4Y146_9THEO|nr:Transglutaminase-like superfamily protein [Caldanaerobius fijiensis DSM 17918]